MSDHLIQIGVSSLVGLTLIMGVINAGYMLISPTAWLALPEWLRIRKWGVRKYGQGWSATQVRVMGGVILAAVLLIGYCVLGSMLDKT